MRVKLNFFGGPIDGAEVGLSVEDPKDLPEALIFPEDDEWNLWHGTPVAYALLTAGPVRAHGRWEAKYERTDL